jgi:molecular chaperone IbpA
MKFFDLNQFLKGSVGYDTTFYRLVFTDHQSEEEGYPPYNIERLGACFYRITLAVAGFSLENLSVWLEDGALKIAGIPDQALMPWPDSLLYQGIHGHSFERIFHLTEGVHLQEALLENGLLHILLVKTLRQDPPEKVSITVIP